MKTETRMGETGDGAEQSYQKYSSRWLVLLTVTMLNLSNNALWISYSAVANVSADYFQKDVNTDIDLLSTISFYVGIPMCLVSTYVVDALGFRTGQPSPPYLSPHLPPGVLLGSVLTFIGALTRALSTLPSLNSSMSLVISPSSFYCNHSPSRIFVLALVLPSLYQSLILFPFLSLTDSSGLAVLAECARPGPHRDGQPPGRQCSH